MYDEIAYEVELHTNSFMGLHFNDVREGDA